MEREGVKMLRYNESAGITPTFSAAYILDEVFIWASGPS